MSKSDLERFCDIVDIDQIYFLKLIEVEEVSVRYFHIFWNIVYDVSKIMFLTQHMSSIITRSDILTKRCVKPIHEICISA